MSITSIERSIIERRRAFHASIAAKAAALEVSRPATESRKELEPQSFPAEPDPPPPLSIVWPAVASGEAIDDCAHQSKIQIDQIMRAVCAYYGVTKTLLISHRRVWRLVYSRQVGMYLARHLTDRSFPEIGRRFGNRDHTTAMHGHRKIAQLLLTDARIAHDVAFLIEQITGVQS